MRSGSTALEDRPGPHFHAVDTPEDLIWRYAEEAFLKERPWNIPYISVDGFMVTGNWPPHSPSPIGKTSLFT